MDLPWLDHPSSAAPGVQPAARSLRLLEVDEARRRAVEDFVRERFAAHYQARVRHFMPRLFALEAADGSLHGAVGCRGAAEQGLFLERYLDEPVESVIARRTGERVEREVLAPLRAELAEADRALAEETAATKVDFFTMVRGED